MALLGAFALLMVAPVVVSPGDELEAAAQFANPIALFENGELRNARQIAEDTVVFQSNRETVAYQRLVAIANEMDGAADDAARYGILARYYETQASFYEDGTLRPATQYEYGSLAQAQVNARRYGRLAEYGRSHAQAGGLWWVLPGEMPALVYLAGAISFQFDYLPEGLLSLPLSLLAPQRFLYSNACLLWCIPAAVVAWRLSRLSDRKKLVGQVPVWLSATLTAHLLVAALCLLAFVLASCIPAMFVSIARNGLGSPLYPVTLVRDGKVLETTLGGVLVSQFAVLLLAAFVVAAIAELVGRASRSATLGALVAMLFCAVPLLPAYELRARVDDVLAWLPQTYLNLRRVAGVPTEMGDLSGELLYLTDSSGAVESVVHGVGLSRAALALGGTALACIALSRIVEALRRGSLRMASPHIGGDRDASRD